MQGQYGGGIRAEGLKGWANPQGSQIKEVAGNTRYSTFQKLGSMLCCAQQSRASSVVTNGFLLTCTRRDAPALSL